MKKIASLSLIVLALVVSISSCKEKKKDGESTSTEQSPANVQNPAENTNPSGPANSAKAYKISFAPDSVYLGKEKEAFVNLLSGEAVELQDADGKATGMNIKFQLRATNKSTLENKKFFNVEYGESRLELDNGTNTTAKTGSALNPDPESSKDGTWEYEIPAGTKPTKLNLFYDGTRVTVALSLM